MTIAIVTGSSSGIGQSAAIKLGKRGVGVIVTYNKHKEGGLETVAQIEKDGGTAVALPLDLRETETFADFKEAVAKALAENWQADSFNYLVNNAGVSGMMMFEKTSEELFDEFFSVNVKGPYFLTQALLPMLRDGGAIVNTTSNSALVNGTEAGYSAYGSTKGALLVLTRYMAFSARGIRVNSVAPGPTRTRIADDAWTKYPEAVPLMAARTGFGRVGEAEDIGAVISSLLSDDWAWATAQNIEASGGFNF
jgi:NAD(P)-dependent dehydrogenase (short-subunit alcohol dehydrogenase family)